MTIAEAREYRQIAERRNLIFAEVNGSFPYLTALATEVVAVQWRKQGPSLGYVTTPEDLQSEVVVELLASGAWTTAQGLPTANDVRGYLWQAARYHLHKVVAPLFREDAETTALEIERDGEEFLLTDWLCYSSPTPEQEVLRGVDEPNYAYRAASTRSGEFLRALLQQPHGELALRWLEGEEVKDLAASEGTTSRTIQNRLFGYLPSAAGRVKDPRGALQRAAEVADLDLQPSAEGFAALRAAYTLR